MRLDAPNLIVANHNLRDVLREKGSFLHYQEFSEGHDYISWRGTFADAIFTMIRNKRYD